jgi:hypothetical protein
MVFGVKWSPLKFTMVYRRKFDIESLYRMINVIKTKNSI